MHSFANRPMYGTFDVVLYFVVIQLFWLLINLLLILSYLIRPIVVCDRPVLEIVANIADQSHVRQITTKCTIKKSYDPV